MRLYNINDPSERVSFKGALLKGLGRKRGLFFPEDLTPMSPEALEALYALNSTERATRLFTHLIGDELSEGELREIAEATFTFPLPLVSVEEDTYACELTHGPTLAFKDVGARFMAQCITRLSLSPSQEFNQELNQKGEKGSQKLTILTATSGDTGAAVAHAFYGLEGIDVVILYPKDGVSPLQEALFCTLGGNIRTLAVEGDFDACQALVKQAFDDVELRARLKLNSANSINIARLLAQVCYYAELCAQLSAAERERLVVSVPSGNFGNLTAALIARALGLPLKRLIVATNTNDTVPRYLRTGEWTPRPTQATLSNAMDVSEPSNWARVEELSRVGGWPLSELRALSLSDEETLQALRTLHTKGYLCEPHGALAWGALQALRAPDEIGVFLCTAHPAKFKERVESALNLTLPLPSTLAHHATLPLLSEPMKLSFDALRALL